MRLLRGRGPADRDPAASWAQRAQTFAEMMNRIVPDADLDYSPESVTRLEMFIEARFDGKPGGLADSENFVPDLGAYVGQVIIRSFGGRWSPDGTPTVVDIGSVKAVFPVRKVQKRIEFGPSESLAWYLTVIRRNVTGD